MASPEIPSNNIKDTISIQADTSPERKHGGWITSPSILMTNLGLLLAVGGVFSNLVVYLIRKYHVKGIDASQISNIINGCTSLAPVVGAIISDSYLGCFLVISVSALIGLLGIILITLTATIPSLRPLPCNTPGLQSCQGPSTVQFAFFYTSIALITKGIGGTRFNIATMGANQFHKDKDQDSFFNWYFFTMYIASVAAIVGIVYIQDNVGWGLGFGLCIAVTAISLAIFLVGQLYYRHVMTKGSPFTCLARVMVAAFRKRKLRLSSNSKDYYYGLDATSSSVPPSSSLSFLNRAALMSQGDTS